MRAAVGPVQADHDNHIVKPTDSAFVRTPSGLDVIFPLPDCAVPRSSRAYTGAPIKRKPTCLIYCKARLFFYQTEHGGVGWGEKKF
jgi:hypothetical protein